MKIKTTAGNVARLLGLEAHMPGYIGFRSEQVVELDLVDGPRVGLERTFAHAGDLVESVAEARSTVRRAQTFNGQLPRVMRISVPAEQQRLVEASLSAGHRPGAILNEGYGPLAESTGMLTRGRQVSLVEARAVLTRDAPGVGMFDLQLISPGVGTSGYYSPAVLEEAGRSGVFAADTTQIFLDHPTETETRDRPERSVRDLAGKLVEAGRWNGEALVARAHVYSMYRPLLTEAAGDIGLSIRAAGLVEVGDVEGRTMQIVSEITEVMSVDFVTKAGRGGRVISVLESAGGVRR